MLEAKKVLTLASLAVALAAGGCCNENCVKADSADATKAPADTKGKVVVVNARCPVNTDDAIPGHMADASCVVEWRGKKVGFCCPGCGPQWKKMSDSERDEALAAVMQ